MSDRNQSRADVLTVLADLLSYAERQICTHENTSRGGAIWEICDDCKAKWADDEGGKPKFKWAAEIVAARRIFDTAPANQPAAAPIDDESEALRGVVARLKRGDDPASCAASIEGILMSRAVPWLADERTAFRDWWDVEYGCTFDNVPGAMGGAFREVAEKAWQARAASANPSTGDRDGHIETPPSV